MTSYEQNIINRLIEIIETKEVSNNFLIELGKVFGDYTNLSTIYNYAKEHNMTYRGVKNHRNIINLFNVNFVIDND